MTGRGAGKWAILEMGSGEEEWKVFHFVGFAGDGDDGGWIQYYPNLSAGATGGLRKEGEADR